MFNILNNTNIKTPEDRCVIKLTTSYYATKKGCFTTISLQYAKRLSYGFNILQEDLSNAYAKDVIQSIINLHECKDGFYEVITCNHSYDYESGYLDGWDLKLIPYIKEQ